MRRRARINQIVSDFAPRPIGECRLLDLACLEGDCSAEFAVRGGTWASIGNVRSFWPTRPSLINAMAHAGFTSVYECQFPTWNDIPSDRVALVGVKGERQEVLAAPFDERLLHERVDEIPRVGPVSGRAGSLPARLARLLLGLR